VAETVTINELGHAGDGIAEANGQRVFVPFTLPGESVAIERNGQRARPIEVVTPSPDRVKAPCRHFGTCGGCALQHMEMSAYLDWKREIVRRSLLLHGVEVDVEAVVATPPGSRRRAIFSAVNTKDRLILGFHRRGTHEIIPVDECPVLSGDIVAALALIRSIAERAVRKRRPARITVTAGNGLDIAIDGGGKLDRSGLEALGRFSREQIIARLTVDGSEVFVNRRPEISAGEAMLLPPAGGFVQASARAEAALADAVVAHVGDAAPVADLFSGIGTFSLRLASHAPVTTVEGEPALLAALNDAVRQARGLKPVTTLRRDLFANPLAPAELDRFGAVVFDPPAAGAKAQAEAIAQSRVTKVAAVSCNPATLGRDARILINGGYRLTRVLPVDQFLWSAEIEVVATFERG
jgi:23S rRNA (uracil1939-C5)-methyltransferase